MCLNFRLYRLQTAARSVQQSECAGVWCAGVFALCRAFLIAFFCAVRSSNTRGSAVLCNHCAFRCAQSAEPRGADRLDSSSGPQPQQPAPSMRLQHALLPRMCCADASRRTSQDHAAALVFPPHAYTPPTRPGTQRRIIGLACSARSPRSSSSCHLCHRRCSGWSRCSPPTPSLSSTVRVTWSSTMPSPRTSRTASTPRSSRATPPAPCRPTTPPSSPRRPPPPPPRPPAAPRRTSAS